MALSGEIAEYESKEAIHHMPEFLHMHFTKDAKPQPEKSIGYYSGTPKLLIAVKGAPTRDEWERLWASPLDVFLMYHEQQIAWASRLVHYMLNFQLVCFKKHEIWSLVCEIPVKFSLNEFEYITGLNCDYVENLMTPKPEAEITDKLRDFWVKLGVDVAVKPSCEDLVSACTRCAQWDPEDRVRLGYLAILASSIDAHPHHQDINVNLARLVMDMDKFVAYPWGRVAFKILISSVKAADISKTYHISGFVQALQSWVYFALPDFVKEVGDPFPSDPIDPRPPLLAYKGYKGRKKSQKWHPQQATVYSYVDKPFDEMFPRWDDVDKDERIVNIVKAMYGHFSINPWQWQKGHWPSKGELPSNFKVKVPLKVKDEVKDEPYHGIKRELEAPQEGSLKKARLSPEFEQRICDALKDVADTRLNMFEAELKGQLVDLGTKIVLLTDKVDNLCHQRSYEESTRGSERESSGEAGSI